MLSKTALLALLSFLSLAAADSNAFTNPSPTNGQSFPQGSVLSVNFSTSYKDPYLALYCSNINNPIILEKAPAPTYKLFLDLAPQPNCYIQIQDGKGAPNTKPSFGTGIFSISESSTGSGNTGQGSGSGGSGGNGGNGGTGGSGGTGGEGANAVCNCSQQCSGPVGATVNNANTKRELGVGSGRRSIGRT